jgi:DNA-directed RNA polymerase specialized sigma24 family protein
MNAATARSEPPNFKRELLATLPSLRAFAVSLSGRHDKADDLVQDTVMKAWGQAGKLRARDQHKGVAVHHPAQRILQPDAQARS